jgi:hypothetical protein
VRLKLLPVPLLPEPEDLLPDLPEPVASASRHKRVTIATIRASLKYAIYEIKIS